MAGVSIATVSRALREETEGMVKPETKEDVRRIAQKLHYVPDRMAQSLRMRRTNTFGFLMNFGTDIINGYIQEILNGALYGLHKVRRDLKIISSERFDSLEMVMRIHGLDGLILPHGYGKAFPNLTEECGKYKNKAWPVVVINDYNPRLHVNQLYSDNRKASAVMVDYLTANGYKNFYYIGSERESPDAETRKKAFLRAIREYGIKFDPDKNIANGHFQENGGYDETMKLLKSRPHFHGVIFCANDATALGSIRAIGEIGLRCPEDIAVVGFDGISIGEFSNPPLTTIKFELYEMGKTAVGMLEKILSGKQKRFIKQKFPFTLVERRSGMGFK